MKKIILFAAVALMMNACGSKQEMKRTDNMKQQLVLTQEWDKVFPLSDKVRAIGISNFDASDSIFESLVKHCRVKPQIMQIECHPYAQRRHWQERCAEEGIQLECWFPLGGRDSKGEILRDPVIGRIAKAHGKSAAQVIIRWHMQEGFSVIPGASNPDYIRENIDVLDFA